MAIMTQKKFHSYESQGIQTKNLFNEIYKQIL
jgi:hypothetical protein